MLDFIIGTAAVAFIIGVIFGFRSRGYTVAFLFFLMSPFIYGAAIFANAAYHNPQILGPGVLAAASQSADACVSIVNYMAFPMIGLCALFAMFSPPNLSVSTENGGNERQSNGGTTIDRRVKMISFSLVVVIIVALVIASNYLTPGLITLVAVGTIAISPSIQMLLVRIGKRLQAPGAQ